MKRNPSLHIRLTDFRKVLKSVGVQNADAVAEAVFEMSVPYHIKDRYVISGSTKLVQKAKRATETASKINGYTPEQFNMLLTSMRMEAGSKRIPNIIKGTAEWTMLREVTSMAIEFANAFSYAVIADGVREYIRIGLKMMGKRYGLNKFKYYNSKIYEQKESHAVLDDDKDPEGSKAFWQCWLNAMEVYAGTTLDILIPEKFVHMIYGREEADRMEADYEDWVTAQFEGLAFVEAIPELSQFYGDNACLRYEKYKLNRDKPKREQAGKGKDEGDDYNLPSNLSAEQAEYFKALKQRKSKR